MVLLHLDVAVSQICAYDDLDIFDQLHCLLRRCDHWIFIHLKEHLKTQQCLVVMSDSLMIVLLGDIEIAVKSLYIGNLEAILCFLHGIILDYDLLLWCSRRLCIKVRSGYIDTVSLNILSYAIVFHLDDIIRNFLRKRDILEAGSN